MAETVVKTVLFKSAWELDEIIREMDTENYGCINFAELKENERFVAVFLRKDWMAK